MIATTFFKEPRWQKSLSPEVEPGLKAWLLKTGSMTKHLQAICHSTYQTNVLLETWGQAGASEKSHLQLAADESSWLREVKLFCDNKVAMYAWTVIPKSTLTEDEASLLELNNKPLGDFLFQQAFLRRSDFEFCKLEPQHSRFAIACEHLTETPPYLWARRSLFYLQDKPLLVSEVFMPLLAEINHA